VQDVQDLVYEQVGDQLAEMLGKYHDSVRPREILLGHRLVYGPELLLDHLRYEPYGRSDAQQEATPSDTGGRVSVRWGSSPTLYVDTQDRSYVCIRRYQLS
jgi:hypothetical protein